MSNSNSYVVELEQLIANKLLPIYEAYCKQNNLPDNFLLLDPKLIQQVKHKKKVAALLRPPEK